MPGPCPGWSAPLREPFFDALAHDFNTPAALVAVFEWVREANRGEAGTVDADLRAMLDVLGLAGLLDVAAVDAPARSPSSRRPVNTPARAGLRRGRSAA